MNISRLKFSKINIFNVFYRNKFLVCFNILKLDSKHFSSYKHFSSGDISNSKTAFSSKIESQQMKKIFHNFNLGLIKRTDYINYLKHVKNDYGNDDSSKSNNSQHIIQKEFIKYLDLAIKKNIIISSTVSEILPDVLVQAAKLEINSFAFWQMMNKLFSDFSHKLGPNLIFKLLEDFYKNFQNSTNVLMMKNSYYANLSRDKVITFNLETLINYLTIFMGVHNNQNLLDEIQHLIVEKLTNDDKNYLKLITLLDYYYCGKGNNSSLSIINLDIILEKIFPRIIKDINYIVLEDKIIWLRIYYKRSMEYGKSIADALHPYLNPLPSSLSLDSIIILLEIYSKLNTGSNELFLDMEKFIGINIEKLPNNKILLIFSSFVNSNKYREKFPLLIQKKVNDAKYDINMTDLSKIIKIFTDINTSNLYIYNNLLDHFNNSASFLTIEDISNVIFAYSVNPNVSQEIQMLDKILSIFEMYVVDKITKVTPSNQLIKILYGFIISSNFQFYKKIIDNLSHLLFSNEINASPEDLVLFSKILEKLNIKNSEIFENLINNNIELFTKNQLLSLSATTKRFNPSNSKLINIIDNHL